jgi:hypothetical protein
MDCNKATRLNGMNFFRRSAGALEIYFSKSIDKASRQSMQAAS